MSLLIDTYTYCQEKRLRVNMGLKNLNDKVKQHQEKIGEKVHLLPWFL
jgi:choline-phosphate cytidylyltransferase